MRHPELREGEIFFFNGSLEQYRTCGWHTKRLGVCAYNEKGERDHSNSYPVFVQIEEVVNYKYQTLVDWDDLRFLFFGQSTKKQKPKYKFTQRRKT